MLTYPVYWHHKRTQQEFITCIEAENMFEVLKRISELHKDGTLSARDYLNNIRRCFADDSGEDWLDEKDSILLLSAALTR